MPGEGGNVEVSNWSAHKFTVGKKNTKKILAIQDSRCFLTTKFLFCEFCFICVTGFQMVEPSWKISMGPIKSSYKTLCIFCNSIPLMGKFFSFDRYVFYVGILMATEFVRLFNLVIYYSLFQLHWMVEPTVAHNCHIKFKSLTANSNHSQIESAVSGSLMSTLQFTGTI